MSVTPGAAAATTGLLGSRSGALEWETTRVSSLTLSGEDRFLELFQKTWFHEDVPTSHHDLLRQAGLRVTAPRLAVLAEVEAAPHSDADTIRNGVSDRLGAVSTQAVYDVLRALTAPAWSAAPTRRLAGPVRERQGRRQPPPRRLPRLRRRRRRGLCHRGGACLHPAATRLCRTRPRSRLGLCDDCPPAPASRRRAH